MAIFSKESSKSGDFGIFFPQQNVWYFFYEWHCKCFWSPSGQNSPNFLKKIKIKIKNAAK
jgi:hypothetical protein